MKDDLTFILSFGWIFLVKNAYFPYFPKNVKNIDFAFLWQDYALNL